MDAIATPPTARERAEAQQLQASDPAVSAFVSASAGSGKTKLLTDRLLRLMLGGADPARIQCLTFTKAAAAEMTVRLNGVLGRWVTLDGAALDAELRRLREEPTAELRERARALFARVLDLPGGMRIGTIHAFCQSLLRRFPLEAQISPHFQLVEGADAAAALDDAREAALAEAYGEADRAALAQVAGLASAGQFAGLVEALRRDRGRLERAVRAGPLAQRRALGVTAASERELLERAATWAEEPALIEAARAVAQRGSPAVAERAATMLDWLAASPATRPARWPEWQAQFCKSDGAPYAECWLVNPRLAASRPELCAIYKAEQNRVQALADACCALRLSEISAALLRLAAPVAKAYEAGKEAGALLDYDDLIARGSALLVDPGAAWVLYKLDGGLDHLLLDEVQDTAPAQWEIAGALTAEFFAGEGAREGRRTIFAVGDRKQSIFAFQGADPDAFDHWRGVMAQRVRGSGGVWRATPLDVSFRSTAPVLDLVDAVFVDPLAAKGVVVEGEALRHYPDRIGDAGSVELWPRAPRPDAPEQRPWTVPDDYSSRTTAPQLLAEALAKWIDGQTSGGIELPSRGQPLTPGDVLVLVRRRNEFGRALVRALKARGVPVAGLDRLVLTEQPAVADLLALCDTLLLPEDDLSLACVLTSPLGGLNDDDLIELAPGRVGTLWDALRARAGEQPRWQNAWSFLFELFGRVDYATPHALLAEALGPRGGRARLFARLGAEAAEPIDELLNAALAYARSHPPSLQGFVQWLRRSAAEVKREPGGGAGAVRVMTVHGAKGLQAPLVILPDTTGLPPDDDKVLWCTDPGEGAEVPIWVPRKALRCDLADGLYERARARAMEEYNRLLYVAMTRAEDRLVVCGWQPRNALPEECWYAAVQRGFARLPATAVLAEDAGVAWPGDVLRLASPQTAPVAGPKPAPTAYLPPLPVWAGEAPLWRPAPVPPEPAGPKSLAPSRPEGAALAPVPAAASPLAARGAAAHRLQRGQLLHALLQHLPDLPAEQRAAAAAAFLARSANALGPADPATLVAETLAILEHPELAPLFGPGSRAEVPVSGLVDGSVVGGLVDRLLVLPDAVLIADYKTHREPPLRVEDTPVLYLRQMAAYRAVLRAIFPGREVVCALVWTEAARVIRLPPETLDAHAPGRATATALSPA